MRSNILSECDIMDNCSPRKVRRITSFLGVAAFPFSFNKLTLVSTNELTLSQNVASYGVKELFLRCPGFQI